MRIKVVDHEDDGTHHEISFEQAANNMMAKALADGAVAMVLIWETPAATKTAAVPYSIGVLKGLTDIAYSEIWIKPEEQEMD